jgi:hypothetical protein
MLTTRASQSLAAKSRGPWSFKPPSTLQITLSRRRSREYRFHKHIYTYTKLKMSGIRILVPVKRVIDYAVSTGPPSPVQQSYSSQWKQLYEHGNANSQLRSSLASTRLALPSRPRVSSTA